MGSRKALAALAALVTGLLMAAVAPAVGAPAASTAPRVRAATGAPYCGITWGGTAKAGGAPSAGSLLSTRVGQHDCWDRLVFEFDGPATGFDVAYGEAYTEGQGLPMSPYTAGGARLRVTLLEPAYGYPYRTGDHVANVTGYRTLRDVVYGGTFEGYSTFAVGVRAQLPFRVMLLSGPDTHHRLVLDVAHQWQE